MIDCHIHLERGPYTTLWLNEFIKTAIKRNINEIYLLEHSHRFIEFAPMYDVVYSYNEYQKEWFSRRSNCYLSIKDYVNFIEQVKQVDYPIKIKFGLEICYFEGFENLIANILDEYTFDFATGSIHWVDGFGFDHKKEFWKGKDINEVYGRYYEIMKSLIKSNLFTGLAHPDSIKAFGHKASYDLADTYITLANLLSEHNMYAEQSGGLYLNYSNQCELGMNETMRKIFLDNGVRIMTASDAHKPEDVGANIIDLSRLL